MHLSVVKATKVLQHTQDCVAYCSSLVIFSSTAGEFDCTAFLLKHKDRFLKGVNTHAIARALEIEKVIAEDLCFELERTGNVKATEMLFLHMRDNCTLQTVHRLCDVMIEKEGFPMMTSLGRDMKEDLPRNYIQVTLHNMYAVYSRPLAKCCLSFVPFVVVGMKLYYAR